ncbi:MAG TPA: hypothetical protein DCG78_01010 [Anaerolineaceae bacterium]|nr:MAG: hypothetical protein XD89_0718 [Anaerolineae bacterium 49_20]HAE85077.1 hypothetical protein [Anaerolineaceae bacterium]
MKSKIETFMTALLLVILGLFIILSLRSTLFVHPVELPIPTQPATETPEDLDPAIAASMDEIEQQVATIRGLEPKTKVPRKLLSEEELQEIVTNEFFADYTAEDAASDTQVLSLLGLLPQDFDLLTFYQELYSEQIAGYYDDEAKAMFVVKGSGFTGVERDTYAHEFTHALQDQHFDFKGKLNYTEESCLEDSERCAAIQSLIEGDATLTELTWLQTYATPQDIIDLQRFYQSYQSPVFDSAPAYMQLDFMFPYDQGFTFVQSLFAQDGYATINRAFTEQNPVSTEQILHPNRYPADTPIPVDLPELANALGSGWEETDCNVMGEWYTYLILAQGDNATSRLVESKASAATEGWGGDTYIVLENAAANEAALLVRYTWDTAADAREAQTAFTQYLALRFGKADSAGIYQNDDIASTLVQDADGGFTWLIAQSPETLNQLLSALY